MGETKPNLPDVLQSRQMALSRWDDEGGAGPCGPHPEELARNLQSQLPPLKDVELAQLRIRVIALENLVIALLAQASDSQLELAREMAKYISPRTGFTSHPLTIQAAAHMVQLVDRAGPFRIASSR